MYWRRMYRIVFPDLGFEFNNLDEQEALNISFSIDKDLTEATNKSKLTIINLSEETIRKIEKADTAVEIYAGYRDNGGALQIFSGSIIECETKDEGVDVVTEMTLSDGQVSVRDTMVTLNFAPDTNSKVIVEMLAKEMNLPLVLGKDVTFKSYPEGYSFYGKAADALSEVCKGNKLTWSIQNGELTIILNGGITAQRGIVFSASSGLIGAPERVINANQYEDLMTIAREIDQKELKEKPNKSEGWRIKVLLSPTVQAGDYIKVESRRVQSWMRVEKIKHSGNLDGGEWITELELVEVDLNADG